MPDRAGLPATNWPPAWGLQTAWARTGLVRGSGASLGTSGLHFLPRRTTIAVGSHHFLLTDRSPGRLIELEGTSPPPAPARQGLGAAQQFLAFAVALRPPCPPAPQVPGFISVFSGAAGSAQAGAAASGGGTQRRGRAPLLSLACKYLLPRWKSDYIARAPLAKSLSKHAQMTAPGGPRHAYSPCTGLVTL